MRVFLEEVVFYGQGLALIAWVMLRWGRRSERRKHYLEINRLIRNKEGGRT